MHSWQCNKSQSLWQNVKCMMKWKSHVHSYSCMIQKAWLLPVPGHQHQQFILSFHIPIQCLSTWSLLTTGLTSHIFQPNFPSQAFIFGSISIAEGAIFVQSHKKCTFYHIEAETKWTPFRRRHLQVHFLEWKCLNSDRNFTEVFSQGSN